MTETEMCLRLFAAAGFGMAIGVEREALDKPAGVRTHLIVSTSAALLTTTSLLVGEKLDAPGEALRVAAGVVTGIGFIGAGTILQTKHSITGLTTAATVFMAAAIGIAVGGGFYYLALAGAGLTIFSTWVLGAVTGKLFGTESQRRPRDGEPRRRRIGSPAAARRADDEDDDAG
jgi:putative Mg2+ transporter-C (MgtC) family protein